VALSSARNWPAGSASTWATSSARRRHRAPRARCASSAWSRRATRSSARPTAAARGAIAARPPFIINRIGIKLSDPYTAQDVARTLEQRYGYKAESWQERSSDFLSLLVTRNIIMYTVVSAILLVASFGIYTAVSNSVADKRRDIAILRSMGFSQADLQIVFVVEGMRWR
jgi:ABC-type antimicrobial peptide transport system permease subunit